MAANPIQPSRTWWVARPASRPGRLLNAFTSCRASNRDLFLWDQALNTERLLPRDALERAHISGTTNSGTPVDYGFGWYTNVSSFVTTAEREQLQALGANLRYVAHGGGCVAYFNYIIRLLDNSAQCWS